MRKLVILVTQLLGYPVVGLGGDWLLGYWVGGSVFNLFSFPNFTQTLLAELLPVGLKKAWAVMQSSAIAWLFFRSMTCQGRTEATMKKMKNPKFTQILLAGLLPVGLEKAWAVMQSSAIALSCLRNDVSGLQGGSDEKNEKPQIYPNSVSAVIGLLNRVNEKWFRGTET